MWVARIETSAIPVGSSPTDRVERGTFCWGAEAIAEAIERRVRKTYWLLENGQLPARKVGRHWVASRERLIAYCSGGEAEPQP